MKSGIYKNISNTTLLYYLHIYVYYYYYYYYYNERGVENVRPSNALGGDERKPGPDGRPRRAAGAVGRRRGLRGVLDDRYDLMMFGMCGVLCLV